MRTILIFIVLAQLASAADWPQWLGPSHDCHAAPGSPQINRLPSEPKVLWRKSIGGGFSSPVIAAGKVVYFDEDGTNEVAHGIEASTGREIWHASIGDVYRDEWS
ncbi:MAG: hypothetical protein ACXWJB_08305, partial [Limisphaerales bacterium]